MNQVIACAIVLLMTSLLFTGPVLGEQQKRQTRTLVEIENPEEIVEVLSQLAESIRESTAIENYKNKRKLDLGFGRGFSGSEAAKHLMGLAAAKYAGGPGRRRRSASPDDN